MEVGDIGTWYSFYVALTWTLTWCICLVFEASKFSDIIVWLHSMVYEEFQETNCMATVTVYFKTWCCVHVKWTSLRPLLGPQNNMEASVIQGASGRHGSALLGCCVIGMAVHSWAVVLVWWNRLHGVKTYLVYFPETLYVYKKQDIKVS